MLTGNPKLKSMGIPWETLDENNQIFIDNFHMKLKNMKGEYSMGIIYCYTNKINNKKYIGQTINPKDRFTKHKSAINNVSDNEYNTPLHRAMRKYGYENFDYEILSEAKTIEELNKLEIYYIEKLNTSIPNGYNIEKGGRNCSRPHTLESKEKMMKAHASLTEEEIIELREAYARRESPKKIYEEKYQDKMVFGSFMNIWTGKRYSLIMPEVFNEKVKHTKLNADLVRQIRKEREETNISYDKLAKKYNISKSTIVDAINRRTWKNVH